MKKVLIVEDDKFLSKAYQSKLTKAGFELGLVSNGAEAFEKLKVFTPDVIVLDLVMPKMDGFAFLTEFTKHTEWKNIPIIIASNLGQKEDIDRGMSLGAKDYFIKSDIELDDLVKKISAHAS